MIDVPSNALRARQMYAAGESSKQIYAETGLRHGTLYDWLNGKKARAAGLALLPLRRTGGVSTPETRRLALVKRLTRAAEKQVNAIAARLGEREITEGERQARLLAVLVKTLGELAAFDARNDHDRSRSESDPRAGDSGPIDVDELRRELAERIARIRGRRIAHGNGGGVAG